jgi:hypothetical protein
MFRQAIRIIWAGLILVAAGLLLSSTPHQGDVPRAFGKLILFSVIWFAGDAASRAFARKGPAKRDSVFHAYSIRDRFFHALLPLLVCVAIAVYVLFSNDLTHTESVVTSGTFFLAGIVIGWRRWRVRHAEIGE